jgi:hypothetical protein
MELKWSRAGGREYTVSEDGRHVISSAIRGTALSLARMEARKL